MVEMDPDPPVEQKCIYLNTCEARITRDFFIRICYGKEFNKCHHYGRKTKQLKTPVGWIQHIAIETDKKSKTLEASFEADGKFPWEFDRGVVE